MRSCLQSLVTLCCLLVAVQSYGYAIDPKTADYSKAEKLVRADSSIATGDTLRVDDIKYYDPSFAQKIDTGYPVRNVIALRINEFSNLFLRDTFTVNVTVRIFYPSSSNPTLKDSADRVFTVHYDSASSYQSVNSLVFYGAHSVVAKVLSVSKTVSWNPLPAIILENQMDAAVTYKFSCTTDTIRAFSILNPGAANSVMDELEVSWRNVIGADEYDLEWAYIDSSALTLYKTSGNFNADLIFRNNASRVSVSGLSYRIPLIYDNSGVLFFRARAVQERSTGVRYEADWSSKYPPEGLGLFSFRGHERKLNWQSSVTYAEEGKRKVVVQYFDGSLRGRQTVTKDNTTGTTIVAENFYDYQGRPVINVLPTPTLNTIIQYSRNFNIGLNGGEYDKSNYDTLADPSLYCGTGAKPMATDSGAARYYSVKNPEKDLGNNKYIPEAGGYAFTEVEYTQDNTGRVSRQGGVGPVYQLGTGHETKYYYGGSPDQAELDALFGTDVGDNSHYQKNMVRDANGQLSVSYIDMHGRTIATALAGDSAVGMRKLSSNQSNTLTENLINPNAVLIRDLVMESKKSLLVSSPGPFDFNYSLSPASLKKEGCNTDSICYDCLYDLEIKITDDCNNQKMGLGGKAFDTVLHNFSLGSIDTSCNAAAGFNIAFRLYLDIGNYEVTKTLSISKYGKDYYRDSVFLRKNACKTLQQFIDQQSQVFASSTECKPTCASCTAALGSWEQFKSDFYQQAGIASADTAAFGPMIVTAYKKALDNCTALCANDSEGDALRAAMLLDMTAPSGQYANPDQSTDKYSIFYSANRESAAPYKTAGVYLDESGYPDKVYDDNAGVFVTPEMLDAAQFASKFKESWAQSLLQLHPEYCKLLKFEQHKTSNVWDRKFEKTDTYAAARAAGYLNPTGNSSVAPYNLYPVVSGNIDPLSQESGALKTELEDSLKNYINKPGGLHISMWGLACAMVKCKTTDQSCFNYYTTDANAFASDMCEGDLDMAWRNFRQLYLNVKRNIVNRLITSGSNPADCTTANSIPSTQLLAAGHFLNFNDARQTLAQSGYGYLSSTDVSQVQQNAQNEMDNYYSSACSSYVKMWVQQLAPCNYSSSDLNNIIIPRLLQVCKEGSDPQHPNGASTVNSEDGKPHQYHSFEEVIEEYNQAHGITNSYKCNAELITAPKPYNQQQVYASKPVWSKPEACECEKINSLYTAYNANPAGAASFSAYVNQVSHTSMSENDLNQLLSLCNNKVDLTVNPNLVMVDYPGYTGNMPPVQTLVAITSDTINNKKTYRYRIDISESFAKYLKYHNNVNNGTGWFEVGVRLSPVYAINSSNVTIDPGSYAYDGYYYTWIRGKANGPETAFSFELSVTVSANIVSTSVCNYLAKPVNLPPALQCYTGDICVTCQEVSSLYNNYTGKYPNDLPVFTAQDSVQSAKNRLFENYMNNRLGFSKLSGDYLKFMQDCKGGNSPCDTLQQIMTDFVNNYYAEKTHIAKPDLSGCDTSLWISNHGNSSVGEVKLSDILRNGVFSPRSDDSTHPFQCAAIALRDTLCFGDGYTFEARFRVPKKGFYYKWSSPYSFFLSFGWLGLGHDVNFNMVQNENDKALYISQLPGIPSDSLVRMQLPSGFEDFATIKIKITPGKFYVYFNGNYIGSTTHPPLPMLTSTYFNPLSTSFELDWMKFYDSKGDPILSEDFNDCSKMAYFKRSQCKPDCSTAFTSFFNQRRGTSYAFYEIDSIYQRTCGYPVNVCDDQGIGIDTSGTDVGFDDISIKFGHSLSISEAYFAPTNDAYDGSWSGTGYHMYGGDTIDVSRACTGQSITLTGYPLDIPNRFNIYDLNGTFIKATNWVGNANYSGPWGSSLNSTSGTVSFTKGNYSKYIIKVETYIDGTIYVNGTTDYWSTQVTYTACTETCPASSEFSFQQRNSQETSSDPSHCSIVDFDKYLVHNGGPVTKKVLVKVISTTTRQHNPINGQDPDPPVTGAPVTTTYTFNPGQSEVLMGRFTEAVRTSSADLITACEEYHVDFQVSSEAPVCETDTTGNEDSLHCSETDFLIHQWAAFIGISYCLENGNTTIPFSLKLKDGKAFCNRSQKATVKILADSASQTILFQTVTFPAYKDSIFICIPKDAYGNPKYTNVRACGTVGSCEVITPCDSLKAIISSFKTYYDNLTSPKPDCQASFAHYYDSIKGTTYTFDELQALSLKQCGVLLPVCESSSASALLLCGKADFSEHVMDSVDNCSDSTFFALSTGTELYNSYLDSLKNNFDSLYHDKCLQAYKYESFTVTHAVSEYHYTLYYYDQAGNLVKTVPPAGVHEDRSSGFLAQVAAARASGTVKVPAHTLVTNYRYNTLNQVVQQKTPDAGLSKFWYDRLGRLAVSQNAKQAVTAPQGGSGTLYSYTLYDVLGRTTQVGQIGSATAMTNAISRDAANLAGWFNTAASSRTEITATTYDVPYGPTLDGVVIQRNLRTRISWSAVYPTHGALTRIDGPGQSTATYYTYDIHGNVDTLVKDYTVGPMAASNRFKKIVYDYDLISGKVNQVAYQPDQVDAFYHRYAYDAENRLTQVETSRDKIFWDRDARYEYYKHGQLARTVLGEQMVQGVDYAYTLQGWLKAINPTSALLGGANGNGAGCGPGTATNDLMVNARTGNNPDEYTARNSITFQEGFTNGTDDYFQGTINDALTACTAPPESNANTTDGTSVSLVAKDAYNIVLNYNDQDYNGIAALSPSVGINSQLGQDYHPLYNGNISSMGVNITKLGDPLLYTYQYDQLNRLMNINPYKSSNETWTALISTNDYKESLSYDANGNILNYQRNGSGANQNLNNYVYSYTTNTNRLNSITNSINNNTATYAYDAIGNVTKDDKQNVTANNWDVYGKLQNVQKTDGTNITYTYDPAGNRISKTVGNVTEWYVRDAGGKIMSVYKVNANNNNGNLTLAEVHLYGSNRLGMLKPNIDVTLTQSNTILLATGTTGYTYTFTRGNKTFDLTDHRDNILSTVSDDKLQHTNDNATVDYYLPDVTSASTYSAYGAMSSSYNANNVINAFNGQRRSTEISTTAQTAEFWEFNSDIGIRWNIDPVVSPSQSPYVTFDNNPVLITDTKGNCPDGKCGDKEVNAAYDIVKSNFDSKHNLKDIKDKLKEAALVWFGNEYNPEKNTEYAKMNMKSYQAFEGLVMDMWDNAIASSALSNSEKGYDHYADNDKLIQSMSTASGRALAIVTLSAEDRKKTDFFMKVALPNLMEFIGVAAGGSNPHLNAPGKGASRAESFTLSRSSSLFSGIPTGASKLLGARGEELTELMLRRAYPNATIAKQVMYKIDRYIKTFCDFVVIQDGHVVALWESKVNGAVMSDAQKALYLEGKAGTFSGKAAKEAGLSGQTIPGGAIKAEARYNSTTGSATLYKY